MKVLISDPDLRWAREIEKKLIQRSMKPEICQSGKDCQLRAYQGGCEIVILDLNTTAHSAMEVLKYLKINFPQIRIIITGDEQSKEKLESMKLDRETLRKLGVSDVLIKPYSIESLIKLLEGSANLTQWKVSSAKDATSTIEAFEANDDEFARIKIQDFQVLNYAAFDYYLRLSAGRFIKILNKGERLDMERVMSLADHKNTDFLYFKTSDRAVFINFLNDIVTQSIEDNEKSSKDKLTLTKSLAEQYVDEIYTTGIEPQLIKEGLKISQNMFELIMKDKGLSEVMKQFMEYDPPVQCHNFLTCFYSILISKNLEWTTPRTVEMLGLGSLLHDIGLLKVPVEISQKPYEEMTVDERKIYQEHPRLGVDLLNEHMIISDPVKQIVYQHHETMDGEGYPNGLNSIKIYPMAKIVGLADEFSSLLIKERLSPLDGLKKLAKNEAFTKKYDPQAIKSLFMGFIKAK